MFLTAICFLSFETVFSFSCENVAVNREEPAEIGEPGDDYTWLRYLTRPFQINEHKLREIFSTKGIVTDVQLKYTKEGVFRQFCFIGYEKEEQAEAALNYFNKSCIETKRIVVEVCAPLGHADKPKAWSKHSTDSSAYQRVNQIKKLSDEGGAEEGEVQEATEKEKRKSKKKEKKREIDDLLEQHQDDPLFAEFMKVHDKDNQLWDNDVGYGEEKTKKGEEGERETKSDNDAADESTEEAKVANVDDVSDLDYLKMLQKKPIEKKSTVTSTSTSSSSAAKNHNTSVDFFTIKIFDLPYKAKRQDVMKFFKPLKPKSVRIPINGRGYCYVGFRDEREFKKALFKNKSFLNGKQIHMVDFTEDNRKTLKKKLGLAVEEDGEEHKDAKRAKWARQEEALRNEEGIDESGAIFFRNLTYSVTEESLQQLFGTYGPIAEIHLPVDSSSRKIKGFGTVTFVMPEHAVVAFSELDGHIFQGRMLHLLPGKKDKEKELDEDDELNALSFKQKKAKKLKQAAGSSHNWNTLFMGQNAVAEVIAQTYGTDKERVLDSTGGGKGAAVRLALGETQVVAEMKAFLEENGVRLDAFEGVIKKRSKTIILVKNLPANTGKQELYPLFSKFGVIGKLVLPPSGVAALVEFLESSEAKRAFQSLAYSKFKTVPLYLEWAPENALKGGTKSDAVTQAGEEVEITAEDLDKVPEKKKIAVEVKEEEEEELKEEVDNSPAEPDTTIFLRNLNYTTVERTVTEHFRHLGPIHMVQVARKKDPKNAAEKISLGYGFIQFKRRATAEHALKSMQFTTIDNNKVELKKSDRVLKDDSSNANSRMNSGHSAGGGSTVVAAGEQTGSKILVRNIPFQAKEAEVRELFAAFGQLRSVRLPLKMAPGTASHRGFGFVDFMNKTDAKSAFEAMQMSTHLYGRRLVLEWAAPEDSTADVQNIRKRTADSFVATTAKRSRKGVFDSSQVEDVAAEDL